VRPLIDKLNPVQEEFWKAKETFVGLYGGIGNGKTTIAVLKGMALSDTFPGNVGVVGRLTYQELIDTTQKEFLNFVKIRNGGNLKEGPYVKRFQEGPPATLTLQNGSEIRFRYADNPDAILGANLGWFYIDQAEFVPEKVYSALEGRLRLWGPEKVAKCKADHLRLYGKPLQFTPREYGFITGNPAPGWVYKRYKLNPSGNYRMIEASTDANKANLPADYLERLRQTNSAEWVARFLDGDWSVRKGQVYKDWDEKIHCIPQMNIPAHWPRFIGWDHGQVHPTSVAFVAVDEENNLVRYKEYHKVGAILSEHAEAVKAMCVGDPVRRSDDGKGVVVFMDPSTSGRKSGMDGRNFKELYADLGIFGINANNQVNAGISKLQALMRPDPNHRFPKWHPRAGEFGSPHFFVIAEECPAFCHEVVLYRWEDQSKKLQQGEEDEFKEVPFKYLDDAMDATRYVVMAVFEHAEPIKKEVIPTYQEWVLQKVLDDRPTEDPDW